MKEENPGPGLKMLVCWPCFILFLAFLTTYNTILRMATAKPFLPGASSLIEQLDTRVLVILRDGRHLLGTLRSLDQFSNLVLEDTYERHIAGTKYADIYLGLYIVRGDSLVLLGQVADDESNEMLTQVEMSEIQNLREKQSKAERVNWDF